VNQTSSISATIAEHVAALDYDNLSEAAIGRTAELFLDWLGSALAGAGSRQVAALRQFADTMGPERGPAQCLDWLSGSSPYFAAMLNASASHVVEQDDLHNGSVLHPATVVFPALLAVCQQHPLNGRQFITAAVAGYETGIRIGEYLGRAHYKVFHTTGTVGTLAAAMTVGKALGLDATTLGHALGSAGTQAAGLWEFLRTAADSKQLHTAKASADGLLSAYTAYFGLTGASRILEGEQGLNAGFLGEGRTDAIVDNLGADGVLETSFKYHASCRHTHPAADALLLLVTRHDIKPGEIESIEARVYQAAEDVLGAVARPVSVHQAKFSMGFVLALIAAKRQAGVKDFTDAALGDAQLLDLHDKVRMVVDEEIDRAYPSRWSARVILRTSDGRQFEHQVDVPKGDPGNALSRSELEHKFRTLASLHPAVKGREVERLIDHSWDLENQADAGEVFRVKGEP